MYYCIFQANFQKKFEFFFIIANIIDELYKGDTIMPVEILEIFQNYMPELLGSLFIGNALFFFGRNDKLEKNKLIFASLAFLTLVFKDLFNILILLENIPPITTKYPKDLLPAVNNAVNPLVALLMIVGGIEYSKTISTIKKAVAIPLFFVCWIALAYVLSLPTINVMFWSNVYLAFGVLVLGSFFCLSRFNPNAYNLRWPGLWILSLASIYIAKALEIKVNWIAEVSLYILCVFEIYRSTIGQLRKDTLQLTKELKETQSKIPMIIQASPFPIIISALKDDRLLSVNEKAAELFNIDTNNIKNFKTEEYFVDPNARKELLQKLSVVPVVENFQTVFRNPNSEKTFWLDISARVIDFDNEVALFSAFKDITAQKKHEQDLFEKAVLDPLTGCYNRRQFLELATKEIRRAWRYDAPFCLMMMDIDHFKMVNDRYGHTFGDEVLKIMARACKQNLRDSDIFARYGGEEFIVLLTNTTIAEGRSVAERVRQAIEKCVISLTTGEKFHFTISLGVVCSQSSDDLDELVKRADSALYAAKKGGRNQVRIYGEQENFAEVKNAALNDLSAEDYSQKIIQQKKSAN